MQHAKLHVAGLFICALGVVGIVACWLFFFTHRYIYFAFNSRSFRPPHAKIILHYFCKSEIKWKIFGELFHVCMNRLRRNFWQNIEKGTNAVFNYLFLFSVIWNTAINGNLSIWHLLHSSKAGLNTVQRD